MTRNQQSTDGDELALEKLAEAREKIVEQLSRVIVGQRHVIDQLLISLFSRGHCLLEGVPGLAKTLMISTLARTLNLSFSRIQFTPDLMPADITGTEVIQEDRATGAREYRFLAGPVFSNVILADEINRTPPKTQAALLEAMQERHVTVGRVQHGLADPFVLATQNPIEHEGTYPLPEAQQDRFMFKVFVEYPSFHEEFDIARRTTSTATDSIEPVLTADQILDLQRMVREVPVSDHAIRYTLALVRQTRQGEPGVPDFIPELLAWGAGPRAVQYLILGAKARALLDGRAHVTVEDIKLLAKPVLRHRLVLSFTAESEGVTADDVVERLLQLTPSKEDDLTCAMPDSKQFLHPEAIKRISRLELRARHIVEGFMSGMHRSPYFGQSVEFLEHRQYTWGDDIRDVDWKVWAKQDRLYVKRYEEDTNLRSTLVVDVSASMRDGSGAMNKYEYTATIAASLAYLILRQKDSVGCVAFDDKVRTTVPQRSKRNHIDAVIQALDVSKPGNKTELYEVLRLVAETYPRRGLVMLVSDLLADRAGLFRGIKLLRSRGHDVMVFHVMDDDELDFPFSGPTRFQDLELPDALACNPRALREGYLTALGQYLEEVRHGCVRTKTDYALLRTSQPLDAALATYLSNRLGMHHRN